MTLVPPSNNPGEIGLAKRILYYAPRAQHLQDLLSGLSLVRDCNVDTRGSEVAITYDRVRVAISIEHDPCVARGRLAEEYFNLVVVDLRDLGEGHDGSLHDHVEHANCFLQSMLDESDIEMRYGFHRVMALVAGPDCDAVDRLIAQLGAQGVARVIRDGSMCRGDDGSNRAAEKQAFARLVLTDMLHMMLGRRRGKRALCAAGGGITGIYFEMGALKCLDDCLYPDSVNTFDMYFGISAGAVVTGFLANGFSMDECMASMAGVDGGRIPPLTLSLFRLANLNFADLRNRMGRILRQLGVSFWGAVRGKRAMNLESFILDYGDLIPPPFHALVFEKILREVFVDQGLSNDFRKLPRPLYVGATDQDTRTHVLFGDEDFDDIAISEAIQASISINPAFRASRIRGRYFEDGGVTRTSNFVEAIRRGADLVFIVDPFVPYVSKEPGFAQQRGVLYNVDQNIRTVSYTRFENMRNLILRHYPQVSSYTFLPANRLRRLMSINPMDHRPYLPIWRGAYLSTLQRILHLRHRLSGDLAAHELRLDTERAEEVAARLDRTETPTFADFFPNGRVELRPSPLSTASLAARKGPSVRAGSPTLRSVKPSAA